MRVTVRVGLQRLRSVAAAVVVLTAASTVAPAANAAPSAGMWLGAMDGGVFALGGAPFRGSGVGSGTTSPVIAIAGRPTGAGYWLATLGGDVRAFGDARLFGTLRGVRLNRPVVDITGTPSGNGYWMVATDGGVFAFGDARFYGGLGNVRINAPVASMAPSPTGNGYWLVGADGGVFAYGDARFYGSLGGSTMTSPVAALGATRDGRGYWLVRRDGMISAFGDAPNLGAATTSTSVAVGVVRSSSGAGYTVAYSDGDIRVFGDAVPISLPSVRLAAPLVGAAAAWASSSGFGLTLLDIFRALSTPPPRTTWPAAHQAALTFDDGPSSYTRGVLSVLQQYGVPATFFTVGYEVAAMPDLVRAEAAAGMSVEVHDWDHADLTRLSPAAIDSELQRSVDAVTSAIHARPNCFRPPYGSTNSTVVSEAAKLGLTQILWNVDPSDYLRPGAQTIAARVLSAASGRGLVIGIHDGGGDRSQTIAALPAIIDGLRARGYTLIKLC